MGVVVVVVTMMIQCCNKSRPRKLQIIVQIWHLREVLYFNACYSRTLKSLCLSWHVVESSQARTHTQSKVTIHGWVEKGRGSPLNGARYFKWTLHLSANGQWIACATKFGSLIFSDGWSMFIKCDTGLHFSDDKLFALKEDSRLRRVWKIIEILYCTRNFNKDTTV